MVVSPMMAMLFLELDENSLPPILLFGGRLAYPANSQDFAESMVITHMLYSHISTSFGSFGKGFRGRVCNPLRVVVLEHHMMLEGGRSSSLGIASARCRDSRTDDSAVDRVGCFGDWYCQRSKIENTANSSPLESRESSGWWNRFSCLGCFRCSCL